MHSMEKLLTSNFQDSMSTSIRSCQVAAHEQWPWTVWQVTYSDLSAGDTVSVTVNCTSRPSHVGDALWYTFTAVKEAMFSPVSVYLSVCLSVCLLTVLLKNYWTNLFEILWNG